MKSPLAPAVDWTGQTWAGRIDQCASMLFCHGYIPLSVREKIHRKLTLVCEAALAAGSETAETNEDSAQCEASQSGPKGNAQDIAQPSSNGG